MIHSALQSVKFKKLKRRLRLSQWETIGLLESVWQFAITDAKLGDIGRHSNEDIAASIEWDKDADELVEALVDCGWIDAHSEHRLVVHDWHEHAPKFLKGGVAKSVKSGGRNFANLDENVTSLEIQALGDSQEVQAKATTTMDIATKRNLTKPNQTKPCTEYGTPRAGDSEPGKNYLILHKPENAHKVKLESYEDFCRADVTSIACTLSGEFTGPGMGFVNKQLKCLAARKGYDANKACDIFREELYRFWRELKSGETVDSNGAAITNRIKSLMAKHGGLGK